MMPGMKVGIVVNPRAGRGRASHLARRAEAELRTAGAACEVASTGSPGAAAGLARALAGGGCEVVFAAGGDGTINEVVRGLVGTGAVLGVIPAGLANVWAADVGLSASAGAFAELIRNGLVFDTDLGCINGRHFLVMAGIGFDAAVVAGVSPREKARWAHLAYIGFAAATAVGWRSTAAIGVLDGRPFEMRKLFGAVAANTSKYAGILDLSPWSRLDDGVLELFLYDDRGLARRVRSTLLADHRLRRWDNCVTVLSGRRLTISTASPLPIHADAEAAGWTPCELRVEPRALRALLPACAGRRYRSPGRRLTAACRTGAV